MKIRIVFSILAAVLALGAVFVGCEVEPEEGNAAIINTPVISGITAPATGGVPSLAITGNEQYSGTVTWSPAVSGTFAEATEYTAMIILTPKPGYTVAGVTANYFSVPGATVSYASGSSLILATFPQTNGTGPGTGPSTVSLFTIPGVNAPNTGEAPATTVSSNQYSGTVTWSPAVSGTFAHGVTYTAFIVLTAGDGFTFQGVTPNSFYVAGVNGTSAANSGVINVVFPPSANAAQINIRDIAGLTAPVAGASPVLSITSNAQYGGTVTWTPTVTGAFAGGTTYTAYITLNVNFGYTLQSVPSGFFNVAGAISVNNAANSGNITAVFPATDNIKINNQTIGGVNVPAVGEYPRYVIAENPQYGGTITWTPAVSGTFAGGNIYTANITLAPKQGYTLTGVTANFFTVAGATSVNNNAGSGLVTAVFPATSKGEIDALTNALGSANVSVSGTTITLNSNLTSVGDIPVGSGITLNIPDGIELELASGKTLTVDGNVTVADKGKLTVYSKDNDKDSTISDSDGILTGNGTLTVKDGGTIGIPNPNATNFGSFTGKVVIEAGAELFALSKDPSNNPMSWPFIGTDATKVWNTKAGADYWLKSGTIEVTYGVNGSPLPASLKLTGTGAEATILGIDTGSGRADVNIGSFMVDTGAELTIGNSASDTVTANVLGDMTIKGNGTVVVGSKSTLSVSGSVTIASGGVLTIYSGVYNSEADTNDGKLAGIGIITIESGGRLEIPDPKEFNFNDVFGEIVLKAGAELVGLGHDVGGGVKYPIVGTDKTTDNPGTTEVGAEYWLTKGTIEVTAVYLAALDKKFPSLKLTRNSEATVLGIKTTGGRVPVGIMLFEVTGTLTIGTDTDNATTAKVMIELTNNGTVRVLNGSKLEVDSTYSGNITNNGKIILETGAITSGTSPGGTIVDENGNDVSTSWGS